MGTAPNGWGKEGGCTAVYAKCFRMAGLVTNVKGSMEAGLKYTPATDGTVLQYEVDGTGEPVVCLHGGLDGRNSFRRQRETLSGGFRFVLRDLRGHNGSEWRQPDDYGIETTEVDDIVRVLDAEGIERAHLLGHSSGGAIAFAFAR